MPARFSALPANSVCLCALGPSHSKGHKNTEFPRSRSGLGCELRPSPLQRTQPTETPGSIILICHEGTASTNIKRAGYNKVIHFARPV